MTVADTAPAGPSPAGPSPAVVAALAPHAARRRRQLLTAAVVFAAVAVLPYAVPNVTFQNILILTLLYAAMSQAWNILGGYCGQISLGQALHFGIGAYATTVLFSVFGVSPWLGMLAGGLIAALAAVALGYPFFRLRGHYFTIATIVVAEMAHTLLLNWEWVGAARGIELPFGSGGWATLQFGRAKEPYALFALGLAAATWLTTWIIEDSRWGYWWRAVKDQPEAAESLGVAVFRSKMAAGAIAAFYAAVGGGFFALFVGYIDPDSVMNFQISLLMALPAVLGGVGTLWGPALGAAVLIPITELTRSYAGGSGNGADLILYGLIIVGVSLAKPEGLIGFFQRKPKAGAGETAP